MRRAGTTGGERAAEKNARAEVGEGDKDERDGGLHKVSAVFVKASTVGVASVRALSLSLTHSHCTCRLSLSLVWTTPQRTQAVYKSVYCAGHGGV